MQTKNNVEELLKPRFLVVADYPGMVHGVGDVIEGEVAWLSKTGDKQDGTYNSEDGRMEDYPHLFRALDWWEKRENKDMPLYFKHVVDWEPFKFLEIQEGGGAKLLDTDGNETCYLFASLVPATEQDYTTYKSTTHENA